MKIERIIKKMKKEMDKRERRIEKTSRQLDKLLDEAMRITEYGFNKEEKKEAKV